MISFESILIWPSFTRSSRIGLSISSFIFVRRLSSLRFIFRLLVFNVHRICLIGASKTHVVYESNLNFRTVNPYLDSLMMNGHIIKTNEEMPRYKTTDKGKELLAVIKEAHEFLWPPALSLRFSPRLCVLPYFSPPFYHQVINIQVKLYIWTIISN